MVNVLLLVIIIIVLLIYFVYVVISEIRRVNQTEYFKSKLCYEYDECFKMVHEMRFVLFKKKMQLFFLNILVVLRELFLWKK